MLGHLVGSGKGFVDFLLALEIEGDCDDAYGKQSLLTRHAGHDGACACACASSHAGSDEHHAGVVLEKGLDFGDIVLRGFTRHLRTVAGAETVADHHFGRYGTLTESLPVGVEHHERHMFDALAEHVVDGVAATTAHADGFYDDFVFLFGLGRFELIGESFGVEYFVHFS